MKIFTLHDMHRAATAVWCLAPLPQSKKVLGSNPTARWGFSVCSMHVQLHMSLWIFFWVLQLPSRVQTNAISGCSCGYEHQCLSVFTLLMFWVDLIHKEQELEVKRSKRRNSLACFWHWLLEHARKNFTAFRRSFNFLVIIQ